MAFGSVATSKVKVILEAQDHVTATLNKLKANFAKADAEMQRRIEIEKGRLENIYGWDKKSVLSKSFTYTSRPFDPVSGGAHRNIQSFYREDMASALKNGFYNPYVSSASIIAALTLQSNRLNKSAKRFVDALITANQNLTKASAKLFEVGGKLTMSGGIMTGAGVAGLRSLYKPLSDFGDFQRNMLEAQVKSGASAAQYNAMVGAARGYASGSSWDPQQVSSVMAKMASMGFKPDQIINSFRQIMDYSRAVGQDDPMWAAQGIGAMMNSFGINAADSGMVSKVIDKMTAAIVNSPLRDDTLREAMKQVAPLVKDKQGTIDDMLAWNMVMATKGIDGSIAGTAQKNFLTRLGKDKIITYGENRGINVYDENGNRRAARQILADIAAAKKMMSDRQWDDFSDKVFGMRSVAGINAVFDENALEQAYSVLADVDGLSEEIREHMESGVFGSLKRIWSALQDMFLEVGKSLENLLKEWEPTIISWFHWATEQVGDNPRFVKWLADAYAWMVQIGIPLTAIGASLMVIGGVLSGFQTIISFIMMACQHVIYPVVVGIGKALGWIFITFGGIGSLLVLVLAAIVGLVAWTGDWGKILTGIFHGGSIMEGIKLMGRSFVLVFKQAGIDIYYSLKYAFNKVLNILWSGIKAAVAGLLHALSYIPGLGKLDEVSKDVYSSINDKNGDQEISREWNAKRKAIEDEYKQYLADVEKYKNDATAKTEDSAVDIAKRGVPVVMPTPQNDEEMLREMQRREAQARADWAKYILPKNPYAVFPGVDAAEKTIAKVLADEEKIVEKARKDSDAKAAAAEKEEASRKKQEEAERKEKEAERRNAIRNAEAEERRKQAEERKAKEFKANQLKRQAELTKNLKPIFQGSMEAAKWLHGLGEYSKDEKETREEEMADNVAGIYDILSSGEGVALMGV